MAKQKSLFLCNQCSYQHPKWMGQCPECGAWGSLLEKKQQKSRSIINDAQSPQLLETVHPTENDRLKSGLTEFDRVMGGGLMLGSVVLLGGEPGIGKSTLLLQVADALASQHRVLYVSAEESASQIKSRANRLGLNQGFHLSTESRYEAVEQAIELIAPTLVVIDSIQTVGVETSESPVGSLSQIREITARVIQHCKPNMVTAILVGHITKDGSIAGPKSLEHMVDGVFYFEGDQHRDLRMIRAQKNRFGATGELGIWRMTENGLAEVDNPSVALLAYRPQTAPGSAVVPCIEGTRPILVEIQVLTSHSAYGTSRRLATGIDGNRLAMLIAVLEKCLGLQCAGLDVFANAVGGMRLREPAIDLGLALALVSSIRGQAIPDDLVAFGEVGLVGEVRSVRQSEARIRECRRLGFKRIVCPPQAGQDASDILEAGSIVEAVELAFLT